MESENCVWAGARHVVSVIAPAANVVCPTPHVVAQDEHCIPSQKEPTGHSIIHVLLYCTYPLSHEKVVDPSHIPCSGHGVHPLDVFIYVLLPLDGHVNVVEPSQLAYVGQLLQDDDVLSVPFGHVNVDPPVHVAVFGVVGHVLHPEEPLVAVP